MKRVLTALLICAAVAAAVLAAGLLRDRTTTPPIVHRFVEMVWEGSELGPPNQYVTRDFIQNRGRDAFRERMRRYAHVLGAFVNIEEELERPVHELDRMEVVLRMAFENAGAVARVELARPTGGPWMIDRFELDADEVVEREPRLEPLVNNARLQIESYFALDPTDLWQRLGAAEQERRTWEAFYAENNALPDQLGAYEGFEMVGEPERKEPGRVGLRWRATFEEGFVDLDQEWVFQDVFWSVERLEIAVTPRG